MNQKGFLSFIVIIGIVILAGVAGYFIVGQQTSSPTPILSPDAFLPKINDLIARGIGQIVRCDREDVQYFYWGSGTALPAAVMRKEGSQSWEARPGIPSRAGGSLMEANLNGFDVNPENCNELYVVTEWAEAYKSRNGGKTWEAINLAGTGYRGVGWGIIAINPKNVRQIVIGTAFPIHSELTRYRIYQSQDGGESFYPVELEREFMQPPTRTEISKLLF